MLSLKDLDSIDDGSFDRMREEIMQITSDEEEQSRMLAARILHGFVKKLQKDHEAKKRKTLMEKGRNDKVKKAGDDVKGGKEGEEEEEEEERNNNCNKKVKKLIKKRNTLIIKEGEKINVIAAGNGASDDQSKLIRKRSSSISHEDQDQEHEEEEASSKKPPKKRSKKKVNQEAINLELLGPPRIPAAMRNFIEQKGISIGDLKLVIVKQVWQTDVSRRHCRFSMPLNQVIGHDFLTPDEKTYLEKEKKDGEEEEKKPSIDVMLIEPCLRETPMRMTRWKMNGNSSYMLISAWTSVLNNNVEVLTEDAIVQVWSFRLDGKVWLTLSKFEREHQREKLDASGTAGSCAGIVAANANNTDDTSNGGEKSKNGGPGSGPSGAYSNSSDHHTIADDINNINRASTNSTTNTKVISEDQLNGSGGSGSTRTIIHDQEQQEN